MTFTEIFTEISSATSAAPRFSNTREGLGGDVGDLHSGPGEGPSMDRSPCTLQRRIGEEGEMGERDIRSMEGSVEGGSMEGSMEARGKGI